jgi:hypothetical protein
MAEASFQAGWLAEELEAARVIREEIDRAKRRIAKRLKSSQPERKD